MPDVAWVVGQREEGCEVIFAETAADAWNETSPCEECRADGACECYPGRLVEREPRFDRYAPGPVPVSAFEAAGWRMRCYFCEEHDAYLPEEAESVGDWTTIVHEGREVPCCHECRRIWSHPA